MKVAVTGISGFIGKSLAVQLHKLGHQVRGLSRSTPQLENIEWKACDAFSMLDCEQGLKDIDVAFYLIHSMLPTAQLSQGSFKEFDLICADNFSRAARTQGVKHIIYLSGFVPNDPFLSPHLESRLEVERTLNFYVPTTTLRAGLIVGKQGSSFQILEKLVRRLPVMLCPKWTANACQPISLEDVLVSLIYTLDHPSPGHYLDIGGPDQLTYNQMLQQTGEALGKKNLLIPLPFLTPGLSSHWVSFFSGVPYELVAPLVESLRHNMISPKPFSIPGHSYTSFKSSLQLSLGSSFQTVKRKKKQYKDVRSVQRLPKPLGKDAAFVAQEYLRWLPQALSFLITEKTQGQRATFHLIGLFCLLEFELSETRSSADRQLFYLKSGLLIKESHRGRLEFRETTDGYSLLAAIHDYRPRLPWFVYKYTQALFHLWVMSRFRRHLKYNFPGKVIVFFDGDCGLCQRSLQFLFKNDKRKLLRYAPLQGETAKELLPLSLRQNRQSVVFFDRGELFIQTRAIQNILKYLTSLWWLRLLLKLFPSFLKNSIYNLIAKHRFRWRKQQECLITMKEFILP